MKYGYALEGLEFKGQYDSKKAAVLAALEEDPELTEVTVCVLGGSIREELYGCFPDGEGILETMNEVAYEVFDDEAGVDNWLTDVDDDQLKDLEQRVRDTIYKWLEDNGLVPDWQPSPGECETIDLAKGVWSLLDISVVPLTIGISDSDREWTNEIRVGRFTVKACTISSEPPVYLVCKGDMDNIADHDPVINMLLRRMPNLSMVAEPPKF